MNLPRAKKRLGQNFLVDESFIARIVDALSPHGGETIVEIGAGRGALTARLVEESCRVVAIEFDRDLAPLLRADFGVRENFELVEADALGVNFCEAIAPATRARVVANLPFNISTAILQHLIAHRRCLNEFTLMLQREVVERITAPPSTSERGYLSVLVEGYCEREALFDVPPGAFRPVPKVWSTVVRLRPLEHTPFDNQDEGFLWSVVSAGFAQRRKTMLNNLRSAPDDLRVRVEASGGAVAALESSEIAPQRRAETLTVEEWARLARTLESG
ncbi:MAG: 16S rRNA (adenine(1518)-N(6)/adenine(1519)-N(6))-dimethyltransferase RsmA [Pyrinomonadaceae bacterium]